MTGGWPDRWDAPPEPAWVIEPTGEWHPQFPGQRYPGDIGSQYADPRGRVTASGRAEVPPLAPTRPDGTYLGRSWADQQDDQTNRRGEPRTDHDAYRRPTDDAYRRLPDEPIWQRERRQPAADRHVPDRYDALSALDRQTGRTNWSDRRRGTAEPAPTGWHHDRAGGDRHDTDRHDDVGRHDAPPRQDRTAPGVTPVSPGRPPVSPAPRHEPPHGARPDRSTEPGWGAAPTQNPPRRRVTGERPSADRRTTDDTHDYDRLTAEDFADPDQRAGNGAQHRTTGGYEPLPARPAPTGRDLPPRFRDDDPLRSPRRDDERPAAHSHDDQRYRLPGDAPRHRPPDGGRGAMAPIPEERWQHPRGPDERRSPDPREAAVRSEAYPDLRSREVVTPPREPWNTSGTDRAEPLRPAREAEHGRDVRQPYARPERHPAEPTRPTAPPAPSGPWGPRPGPPPAQPGEHPATARPGHADATNPGVGRPGPVPPGTPVPPADLPTRQRRTDRWSPAPDPDETAPVSAPPAARLHLEFRQPTPATPPADRPTTGSGTDRAVPGRTPAAATGGSATDRTALEITPDRPRRYVPPTPEPDPTDHRDTAARTTSGGAAAWFQPGRSASAPTTPAAPSSPTTPPGPTTTPPRPTPTPSRPTPTPPGPTPTPPDQTVSHRPTASAGAAPATVEPPAPRTGRPASTPPPSDVSRAEGTEVRAPRSPAPAAAGRPTPPIAPPPAEDRPETPVADAADTRGRPTVVDRETGSAAHGLAERETGPVDLATSSGASGIRPGPDRGPLPTAGRDAPSPLAGPPGGTGLPPSTDPGTAGPGTVAGTRPTAPVTDGTGTDETGPADDDPATGTATGVSAAAAATTAPTPPDTATLPGTTPPPGTATPPGTAAPPRPTAPTDTPPPPGTTPPPPTTPPRGTAAPPGTMPPPGTPARAGTTTPPGTTAPVDTPAPTSAGVSNATAAPTAAGVPPGDLARATAAPATDAVADAVGPAGGTPEPATTGTRPDTTGVQQTATGVQPETTSLAATVVGGLDRTSSPDRPPAPGRATTTNPTTSTERNTAPEGATTTGQITTTGQTSTTDRSGTAEQAAAPELVPATDGAAAARQAASTHLPQGDPEQALAGYRWQLDPQTLREVVDDPTELRLIRRRLTEKLASALDNRARARLLSLRAVLSRLVGDLADAVADGRLALTYAEATGELRRTALARARLAEALRWKGEFAEADRLFAEANSTELPDRLRSALHEHAGRCCYDQGRLIEACGHFERALDLHRADDPELTERIGVALDAVYARAVAREGFGPYPRSRDEVRHGRRSPRPTQDGRGRWGYADTDGDLVVDYRYAEAQPFHERLAWVRHPDQAGWELIDESGVTRLDTAYARVLAFSDGLAWVSQGGDADWSAIEPDGTVVVPAGFEEVRPFRAGVAAVRRGGWGAVDRHGRLVVPPRYHGLDTMLSDGRRLDGFTDEGLAVVELAGRRGVLDRTGAVLVRPVHPALVIHPVAFLIGDGMSHWGALDRRGEPLIPPVHPDWDTVVAEIDRLLADTHPVL
ncbi:WG repeat-containing protein [Micromonospora sp. NPDC049081]|uniref:WG repeat-containing protein n=1 Tax=Micromonospora sp. NPDC049081 TaxID=3155150 RepID=UPI0033EF14CD